jgi:hypothetical protein
MTPYQLAVKAFKTDPEKFLDDSCPVESNCATCPFKWQSHFPADPKTGVGEYTCGIDPDYIRNTGIIDQLKIDYPEYYL